MYDALNVFSALKIVSKERTKIVYLPERMHQYPANLSSLDDEYGCEETLPPTEKVTNAQLDEQKRDAVQKLKVREFQSRRIFFHSLTQVAHE